MIVTLKGFPGVSPSSKLDFCIILVVYFISLIKIHLIMIFNDIILLIGIMIYGIL